MENQQVSAQLSIKKYFEGDSVQKKFKALLGNRAPGFITSVLQVISSNTLLSKADPVTVYQAAATAAVLDLPIHNSLGHAWIVPYKGQAAFQIGWKGLVQLGQRSGQYLRINVTEVYENQFKHYNQLTEELEADFGIEGEGDIVGYAAYFRLVNGFEKLVYWSKKKVTDHAQKYSQAFKGSGMSPWKDKDQFHEMAKKTVLKNTLSKWGPLSIEMQRAVISDQAVIKDLDTMEVSYPDNEIQTAEVVSEEKEKERIAGFISNAKTIEELQSAYEFISEDQRDLYNGKLKKLSA